MAYKTILTILTDSADADRLLPQVMAFATACGAHLDVLCMGIDRTQTGYYFAGASALMHEATLAEAQVEAQSIETHARTRLTQCDTSWSVEAMIAQSASVSTIVARRARFSDLVILGKPYGAGIAQDAPALVESAMFQGHAPVIVLDAEKSVPIAPQKVVIAWNDTDEALAAVRMSMPFLTAASAVNICVVAPERHAPGAPDPGAELARMLSRHGVHAEISLIPQTLNRVSEVIARHAADQDADLLVMGAYGHSRFREAILGGATRNMLEHASLPVLMAH